MFFYKEVHSNSFARLWRPVTLLLIMLMNALPLWYVSLFSQLLYPWWFFNLEGHILLCGLLKFEAVFVAKMSWQFSFHSLKILMTCYMLHANDLATIPHWIILLLMSVSHFKRFCDLRWSTELVRQVSSRCYLLGLWCKLQILVLLPFDSWPTSFTHGP